MKRYAGFLVLSALLIGSIIVLSNLFRRPQESRPVPEPAQVYTQMRSRVLGTVPSEVGIVSSSEMPNVWGVLMETGYDKAVVTLVSLADGTTSLYFGNGGGIIGGGQYPAVANASKTLVSNSEQYFMRMTPTSSYPLPAIGRVKFYILTFTGAYTVDVGENELGKQQHELSPLFFSAQEVITQLRLYSAQQK